LFLGDGVGKGSLPVIDFTELQSSGFEAENRTNLRQAIAVEELQPGSKGTEPRAMRVIVIDDDRDTAECTSRLIRLWGHDVRHANNAQAGLEAAVAFRPDFLLLDVAMP
jgi:PleD family two-component response regulator